MKIFYLHLLFFLFIFTSYIYPNSGDTTQVFDRDSIRTDLTDIVSLGINHFLLKNDPQVSSVMDSIKISSDILTELLKPPYKEPPQSYLESIKEIIGLINKSIIMGNRDSTLLILSAVNSDLRIKSDVGIRGTDESQCYVRNVKVFTRILKDGDYEDASGYIVKCNPWTFRDNFTAKYTFNNNTSPASEKALPIGVYYFWVEKPGDSKRFPEEMRQSEVEFMALCEPCEIKIDVE